MYVLFVKVSFTKNDRFDRYILLFLYFPVAILIVYFNSVKNNLRKLGVAFAMLWLLAHGSAYANMYYTFTKESPINPHRELLNEVKRRGMHYAIAHYWTAYYLTFLSDEEILVGCNFVRIPWINQKILAKKQPFYFISEDPCTNGEKFLDWYFCGPIKYE